MAINGRLIAGIALGVGAVALLGACANRGGGGTTTPQDGPMADLTRDLMARLKPGTHPRLSVTADAVRQVRGDDGRSTGAYDGTRLLQAADAHVFGTPTIANAATDVKGDGFATFNEIRHVVRHYDADASGRLDIPEIRAFEATHGVRWIPA